MTADSDTFRWGRLVVSCLLELRERQAFPVRFVDHEVIPPFSGSPEGISVWFICSRSAEAEAFRSQCLEAATEELRSLLLEEGFPPDAAPSLRSDVTSLEAIDAAGGRFAFFR